MPIHIIKTISFVLLLINISVLNTSGKACHKTEEGIYIQEVSNNEKYNEEPTISLNDFVTQLENDLFIKSMHINLVFSSKDDQGNYHTWISPENFFHTSFIVKYVLNYGNFTVCIGLNGDQDEIIVYNKDITINKQREIGNFTPKYICGNMLYGDEYSESFDNRLIRSINLDNLKTEDIYSYGGNVGESQSDFIIDSSGNVIVYKINDERNKTFYYQCDNGKLKPILETKLSVPIYYDIRGLFYLETDGSFYSGQTSEANLMLWNGSSIQKVAKIKTVDMNGELFANGIPGNVMVYNDNIISIHQSAKEPYVLVQKINSSECKKKLLKTWNFTEADMERNGETFSGIYFENGRITNYFYSETAGMLQTQVIDII